MNINNKIILAFYILMIYLIYKNYCIEKKVEKFSKNNKENFSNGFQDDKLLNEDIQRKVNKVFDELKLPDQVKKLTDKINTENTKKIDNEVSKNIGKIDGAIKKIPKTVDERVKVIYKTDIDAIRNLSTVSDKLQSGGLTIPGDLTVKGKFNYLPKGTIVAYNGTTAPPGWAICDGREGRPNLKGKFIYGYAGPGRGRSNRWKEYSGAEYVQLTEKQMPKHDHSLTINNDGNHYHGITTYNDDFNQRGGGYGAIGWENHDSNNQGVFKNTNEGGSHNHGHSMGKTGSSHSHENMPPYCVLLYIIKL